jgi:hypothetical protein
MAGTATKLGPGTLTIGAAPPAGIDLSCQLSAAKVAWDKDKEDDTPTLCGDTIAGSVDYTATLSGTVLLDLSDGGMVDFTWTNKGGQYPFVFVPNDTAAKAVTGDVIVDPLDVGGDEVKKNMTADFEWDIVGEPVWDDAPPPVAARSRGSEKDTGSTRPARTDRTPALTG